MEKADPLDLNAIDGILYYYNTTLPWGFYKFQINCSDGVFTNSTEWIIGPEVNPFYGLNYSSQQIIINEIYWRFYRHNFFMKYFLIIWNIQR